MNPSKMNVTNSADALLILRAIACFMVLEIHCSPPRDSLILGNYDLSWLLFLNGTTGVWIFFCLSGYLIGKGFYTERYRLTPNGILNFWKNRALRIFPLYYFSILVLTIFVYPEIVKSQNWATLVNLLTFTYPGGQFPPATFNTALWSLSTEVQFYILAPLFYAFSSRFIHSWRRVLLSILSAFILIFLFRLIIWISFGKLMTTNDFMVVIRYWYSPLFSNLDLFLVGFLLNPIFKTLNKKEIKYPFKTVQYIQFSAIVLFIICGLFTSHHLYYQELWGMDAKVRGNGVRTATMFFLLQPLIAIITSYFIYAFDGLQYDTYRSKLNFESIAKNPLRIFEIFGTLSYGIYVWHFPIIEKFLPIAHSSIALEAFYNRVSLTVLFSLILSAVTYQILERPASNLKTFEMKPDRNQSRFDH